jgi:hypothetical protein
MKKIRKFISAAVLSGAIAAYAAFGCGVDELANKNKQGPVPKDEIINTDYDAGSMLPDFGVQDAGYDAGRDAQVQADTSHVKDQGLEDVIADSDASLNCPQMPYSCSDNPNNECCKRINCTGVLVTETQCDYMDGGDAGYTQDACKDCDVDFTDISDASYVSDAGTLDSSDMDGTLDAESADAVLEDVLNADAGEADAETLDGAVADAGSMAPVVKYLLNGTETASLSLSQTDYLQVDASSSYSPKTGQSPMDGISHCNFGLGGYVSKEEMPDCRFETDLYVLPAEQEHSLYSAINNKAYFFILK